jgi:hypothetical protein
LSNSNVSEHLLTEAVSAFEAGKHAAFSKLLKTGEQLGAAYNMEARALKADVCAENPNPSGPDPSAKLTA